MKLRTGSQTFLPNISFLIPLTIWDIYINLVSLSYELIRYENEESSVHLSLAVLATFLV
jgi:hypothetical protein